MKTIAFFNNKGGVGKTSLVYHLAWMYAELGLSVVAADLDPQANLTSMFLDDDRIDTLWEGNNHTHTVFGAIQPLIEGTGDVASPHLEKINDRIGLLVGDLALSTAEEELTTQWPSCLDKKPRAFRVLSAFWRMMRHATDQMSADLVLIDVGPNLGALNRATLISSQHVVIPLAPDLYSLQGLANLGPTLIRWRSEWKERFDRNPVPDLDVPTGNMRPAGYVVLQHAVRLDRPVKAYDRWISRIPEAYLRDVLNDNSSVAPLSVKEDPHCLATLKHYRSLMPLAQEAHKPMFFLKPADGAIGGHSQAVLDCYRDFEQLARSIADATSIALP